MSEASSWPGRLWVGPPVSGGPDLGHLPHYSHGRCRSKAPHRPLAARFRQLAAFCPRPSEGSNSVHACNRNQPKPKKTKSLGPRATPLLAPRPPHTSYEKSKKTAPKSDPL